MRKKRWKKILIWTASIIVLLGIGGLFAANYAMDRMIAQLSASLEDELLAEALGENVAPSGRGEPDEGGQEQQTDNVDPLSEPADNADAGNESSSGGGTSSKPDNGTASQDGSTASEYSAEISTDKAREVQEKITVGEKAKLAAVFLKELSADDIRTLQQLASGGLNTDEKKQARDLILDRLTPEQYDELIVIAKKYGMSQGRSYAEVSQEK